MLSQNILLQYPSLHLLLMLLWLLFLYPSIRHTIIARDPSLHLHMLNSLFFGSFPLVALPRHLLPNILPYTSFTLSRPHLHPESPHIPPAKPQTNPESRIALFRFYSLMYDWWNVLHRRQTCPRRPNSSQIRNPHITSHEPWRKADELQTNPRLMYRQVGTESQERFA